MQINLNGRNALVTGGSLGLGRAIAAQFCEAGANVAIVARRQNVLDEAADIIGSAGKGRVITVDAPDSHVHGLTLRGSGDSASGRPREEAWRPSTTRS